MSSKSSQQQFACSSQLGASNVLSIVPSTQGFPTDYSGLSNLGSTLSKTQCGLTKHFIFSSEWNFLPEGVKSVKTALDKELRTKNITANIEWNGEDHTFRISCPREFGESVWESFFKIIQVLMREEVGDVWDLDDDVSESEDQLTDTDKITKSNKIQQVSANFQDATPADDIHHNASDSDPPSDFPPEVRSFRARIIWEHQEENPPIDTVVPDELLHRLGLLIDGKLVKDLNSGKIFVGAHSEEECHRAIHKLDNIRKTWVDLRYPSINNILYPEEFQKYEISFQHIVNVKKKFFETTLLENLQILPATFDYSTLKDAVTIRCSPFNNTKSRFMPFKVGKYTAAAEKEIESSEWNDVNYASYTAPDQDEMSNTMARFNKYTRIALQLQQEQSQQSSIQDKYVAGLDESTPTPQDAIKSIQRWNENVPGQALLASRLPNYLALSTRLPLSEQMIQSNGPNSVTVKPEPEDLISFKESDFFEARDIDAANLDLSYPPILPIRKEPALKPVHMIETSSSFQPLIILSDKLQAVDEVATRNYRSTMSQKAPKPNRRKKKAKTSTYAGRLEAPSPPHPKTETSTATASVTDVLPEFITAVEKGFVDLLQGLRGFQGAIAVQIEFGRLLLKQIPRNFISVSDSEDSVEINTGLRGLEGSTSVFTKVLTTLPSDVTYMAKLKDQQGKLLWHSPQSSSAVSYEIICVDNRLQEFTVEINAEAFEARVLIKCHLGEVNIHALKRHWDFRMTATGVESSENVDPSYEEFAEIIKKTLFIPTGSQSPVLYFEVPDQSIAHFAVHAVRSRRINRYFSSESQSILNISEVRELQVEEIAGDKSTIYKWFGSMEDSIWLPDFKYKHLFIWYEATISCPKFDEEFQENKTLELGEEATWTAELLAANAVRPMLLPACEMVKQMDGVGFYNNNDISKSVPAPSMAKTAKTSYSYW